MRYSVAFNLRIYQRIGEGGFLVVNATLNCCNDPLAHYADSYPI